MIIQCDYEVNEIKILQGQSGQVQDPRPEGIVSPANIQKIIRVTETTYYWYEGSINYGEYVMFDVIGGQPVNVRII